MRGENYMLQYFCRTEHREIDICSRIQVAILGLTWVREVFLPFDILQCQAFIASCRYKVRRT